MKYIRTKDGIVNVIKTAGMNEKYVFEHKDLFEEECSKIEWYKHSIKQADSIEELIDELVIHNPSNDGYFYPKYFVYQNKWETMLKPISDYQKSKGIEIYGAIWTDKGLIFVAKMNEKGKLKLL